MKTAEPNIHAVSESRRTQRLFYTIPSFAASRMQIELQLEVCTVMIGLYPELQSVYVLYSTQVFSNPIVKHFIMIFTYASIL